MEKTNLMVVICDLNPSWWGSKDTLDRSLSFFKHCMDSLLVFCNSYLMTNHKNKLAFIACHTDECTFLYPNEDLDGDDEEDGAVNDGKFEVFVRLNNILTKGLQTLATKYSSEPRHGRPTLLAGALTKALCYIHSFDKEKTGQDVNSHIFIMKGSPDVSSQYMPVMNCIFAAQKKNIPIDSCSLAQNSGFLQQASDITNGTYFNIENPSGLLQYMIWMFLPEPQFREKLNIPSTLQIDYRAACFCHKQLVDVGFVCSVCLSIYCQFLPKCLTCQTRFKLPSLPVSKPKKRKKDAS